MKNKTPQKSSTPKLAGKFKIDNSPEAQKLRIKEAKYLIENLMMNGKPAYKAVKTKSGKVVYELNS